MNDSIAYVLLMTSFAVFTFLTGILAIDMFNYTALKQVTRIRKQFFQSLIRQDIAWYDVSNEMNFAVGITEWVIHKCESDFRLLIYFLFFLSSDLCLCQRYWEDSWWHIGKSEQIVGVDSYISVMHSDGIFVRMGVDIGNEFVYADCHFGEYGLWKSRSFHNIIIFLLTQFKIWFGYFMRNRFKQI